MNKSPKAKRPIASKAEPVEIITLSAKNLDDYRQFCGRSLKYAEAYDNKGRWLQGRFKEGLRYKLLQAGGRTRGFLEYIPGQYAWRGVAAKNYLFIHCFWVLGKNKGQGYGTRLLDDCLKDAQAGGFAGVAVMTSFEHWLPNKKIFLKHGFEQVDSAPPAFELFVKRLKPRASPPKFTQAWKHTQAIPKGLTMYTSDQCPYIFFTEQCVRAAGQHLGEAVNFIRIETAQAAQQSPCPYGVMGIFYNGQLLSYRPTGTRDLIEAVRQKQAA